MVQAFRADASSEREEKDITVSRNISCAKTFSLGQNLVGNAQQQIMIPMTFLSVDVR